MYHTVVVLIEIVTVVNMDKEGELYVVVEKNIPAVYPPLSVRPNEMPVVCVCVCC